MSYEPDEEAVEAMAKRITRIVRCGDMYESTPSDYSVARFVLREMHRRCVVASTGAYLRGLRDAGNVDAPGHAPRADEAPFVGEDAADEAMRGGA